MGPFFIQLAFHKLGDYISVPQWRSLQTHGTYYWRKSNRQIEMFEEFGYLKFLM